MGWGETQDNGVLVSYSEAMVPCKFWMRYVVDT